MKLDCKICGSQHSLDCGHFDGSYLKQCVSCSVIFRVDDQNNYEDEEDDDEKLKNVWQEYERLYYPGRALTYSKVLEHLGIGDNRRLLDVGSALGWFMEKAAERGFQTWGVEPSKSVAHLGQNRTNRPVQIAKVENIPHPDKFFNVVTLFDVLEHTENPAVSLQEVSRVLSDNGILVLRIPDADGLLPRISHILYRITFGRYSRPLRLLYRFHRWGFNLQSIYTLMSNSGFEILQKYSEDAQDLSVIKHKEWAKNPIVILMVTIIIYLGRIFGMKDELVVITRKIRE